MDYLLKKCEKVISLMRNVARFRVLSILRTLVPRQISALQICGVISNELMEEYPCVRIK